MIHYCTADILKADKFFRRNLINSLAGYKPALLIGTKSKAGHTNLAIFSQVFHIGATPPLLGVLFRPDSVERHTLQNIRENGHFTLNQTTTDIIEQAHQTSARYATDQSEFEATGLTPEYKSDLFAPFVKESPVQIYCQLAEEVALTINGTILVIGAIKDIFIEQKMLSDDGFINPAKGRVAAAAGLDAYFKPELIARYSYAKPDKKPETLL
ncbi:MAG: flavin reductase family protein [Flavobacteriales bacterium]